MHDRRHAGLARRLHDLGLEACAQRQREQLILGAEISALQPADVLRPLRRRAGATRVPVDRPDAASCSARMQASLCSGVWLICERSMIAVVPMSMKPSAVVSTPA